MPEKNLTAIQKKFVDIAVRVRGSDPVISRKEVQDLVENHGAPNPSWLKNGKQYRVRRGVYRMPIGSGSGSDVSNDAVQQSVAPVVEMPPPAPDEKTNTVGETFVPGAETERDYVPEKVPYFVPYGCYNDLVTVMKSNLFNVVWITGLSGNGKTMMIEQAAAQLRQELFTASITAETNENDLLGGYRLVNGQMVWFNGPAINAMRRGGTLLLDEVDLGTSKIMCLQPILNGKSVFVKKINRWIHPARGFKVIMTSNTKGNGSEDGTFIGTNILNEAFKDRAPIMFEHDYPTPRTEKKILRKSADYFSSIDQVPLSEVDGDMAGFFERLTEFGRIVRDTYEKDGIGAVITTRRLADIVKNHIIFRDRAKAVALCLNRFDSETKMAMTDLYRSIDDEIGRKEEEARTPVEAKKSETKSEPAKTSETSEDDMDLSPF